MQVPPMTTWWLRLSVLLVSGAAVFAQDHLVPEDGNTERERTTDGIIRKNFRAVLLKDAAQYFTARLVCNPSFDPEWVVTVVRECAEKNNEPDHAHRVLRGVCRGRKEPLVCGELSESQNQEITGEP